MEVLSITLPEDIKDITLGQFLKLQELEKTDSDYYTKLKRKISIVTGVPFAKLDNVKQTDFERINQKIDEALSKDAEFCPKFEIRGIKYGFIPNLDKITFREYVLLSMWGVKEETLPELMSVLFRPIVKEEGENYEIMPYQEGDEYLGLIREMPLHCVNGALVFFCNLAKELEIASQRYLTEELQKEIRQPNISRISAGIQRLKNWLATIF